MKKYTRISLGLIASVCLLMVVCYRPLWKQPTNNGLFTWDAGGYYAYLPASFIYHDLKQLNYCYYIQAKYNLPPSWAWEVNGNKLLQYSCGQAVMELPWFGLAHLVAKVGRYDADGFSMPYQLVVQFGMLLWCLFGVAVLGRVLLLYFEDRAVALSLFLVTLVTNYLAYATTMVSHTHAPLFTVYALMLWQTIRFYKKVSYGNAALIGVLAGIAALTRPTELIIVLLPLLWGVSDKESLLARFAFVKNHLLKLGLASLVMVAFSGLQFAYWKHVTGHFIFYSYGDQTFSFLKPHLYNCFFSTRKGWLVYSPIMLLSLIGFYYLWKSKAPSIRQNRLALTSVALVAIWIAFSWDIWWYGGGLGQRAMIQYYPILAFPLAALVQHVLTQPKRIYKIIMVGFMAICTYHNIWLIHGATYGGYINTEETNDAYFFATLWRWRKPDKATLHLLDNPENKLPIQNPHLIYQQDFEQDSSKAVTTQNPLQGKASLRLNQPNQIVELEIPVATLQTARVQVKMQLRCDQREWDFWKIPHLYLNFYRDNQLLKSSVIRIQRDAFDGEQYELSLTCDAPTDNITAAKIVFNNLDGKAASTIDDIAVWIGDK